ncbi:MAG: glycosyltransferase family protein [Gemmobacter sp.]
MDARNPTHAASTGPGAGFRVLLYSHDTFGLGHLRRTRTIASALTEAFPDASALIVTGSPVAGRFTFPERVDHIRLPGVTKLEDGSYSSDGLGLDIDETTWLRGGLIETAAERFAPDLVIVDKEPTGFRGEMMATLARLRRTGRARIVLGLRDVLDAPEVIAAEWARKGAAEAAAQYFDEIWVYGDARVFDPTADIGLPPAVRLRTHWTGYLRRDGAGPDEAPPAPYVLVTPGGGGDGAALVDQVLRAYEADPALGPAAHIVYGPFLAGDTRAQFEARVARLAPRVGAVGFDSRMEALMQGAQGVIAMGGYNTFCEILSFDKPALIVPRSRPRMEQTIRAREAARLGLVRMLGSDAAQDPAVMAAAIRALATQPPPSAARCAGLLDGLPHIVDRTRALLRSRAAA